MLETCKPCHPTYPPKSSEASSCFSKLEMLQGAEERGGILNRRLLGNSHARLTSWTKGYSLGQVAKEHNKLEYRQLSHTVDKLLRIYSSVATALAWALVHNQSVSPAVEHCLSVREAEATSA